MSRLAVLLALALLVGCAADIASQRPAPEVAAPASGLAALDSQIAQRVEAGRYPGAVFLVATDRTVLHEGVVGMADRERDEPMRPDSIFRLMSMTKPVTAVAVMILADDGRLRLDDPVAQHLPELEAFGSAHGKPLTLRHLLTHTGGMGFGSFPVPGVSPATLAGRVEEIGRKTPQLPPGQRWQYSGVDAFDILARVVETVSGEPYERFLQRRLFDPLEMKDTTYVLGARQTPRLVGLYAAKGGTLSPASPSLPDVVYPSGGAGLYSTGRDMMRFAQMLAGGGRLGDARILSAAAVDEMAKLQLPGGFPDLSPGLGWGLGMRVVADPAQLKSPLPAGAYGWSGAYGTHFWVDPERRLAAVWMINLTTAGGAGSPDALEFERLVMQACAEDRRCRAPP